MRTSPTTVKDQGGVFLVGATQYNHLNQIATFQQYDKNATSNTFNTTGLNQVYFSSGDEFKTLRVTGYSIAPVPIGSWWLYDEFSEFYRSSNPQYVQRTFADDIQEPMNWYMTH